MERMLRILSLEDDPNDTELIQARLEEEGIGCEMSRVETEQEFISGVEQGGFDLLLVDYKLPVFDGMSALAIAKEKCPDIPFVFVSGSIGEDIAIEALKNGATDYVLKDKLSRLAPAVRRALQEAAGRRERKKAEERLTTLNKCFLEFGADPIENINRLVSLCGKLMGAASAFYNRLDNEMLCSWGQWNVPPDYNSVAAPEGHICYDVLKSDSDEVVVIRNLPETPYARTDPAVTRYSLQTYVGLAVKFCGAHVGALCVVYQKEFVPSEDDKNILGIIASAIGVEEKRLRAENLFRELSRKMELILNSAGEGIYGLDLAAKVTFINPAASKMLGCEKEELIGRGSHETWHHSKPDGAPFPVEECSLNSLLRDGIARTEWSTFWRRDGKSFPVEFTTTPIYENEILNGAVVIFKDITERVQAQKEKEKLEEQLRQAQKIEAVGTLAAGVAHDFNNILSTIIGYGHLTLMKMAEDDPLRLNLQQILESADRATTLTQSLLAFSRKQTINPGMINLNDMLKRFEKILQRLLREDIELKTVCTAEDLLVMADHGQIEQVLMNLATNARDAMPEGGHLTIETSLIQMDEQFMKMHGYGKAGAYALISVTDTGTGMDKETLVKIFEPFFTTKEQGKGTGLGLAMVYGTIRKHEGFINVYSEEGKGTSFKIYLPIVRKAVETREKEAAETVPPRGGTETVLVAEDDESLRKLTETVLEHFGYKVIVAVDGEEAVKQFIENKDSIQLIILDGIMPKKNGKEAYEEIRALRPDIKAIFVSGYAEDVFTKEGIPQDRVTFLLKPVMPTYLVKKVRDVLDRE